MQKLGDRVICSPSDLVKFLECEHLTALDRVDLDTPLPRAEAGAETELMRNKGFAHEAAYLGRLRASGVKVEDLSAGADLDEQVAATMDAMRRGAPVIYQATFRSGNFVGHADFLRRVDSLSALGRFGYEVLDTKLARTPKAKFLVQLCCYSDLLAEAQGRAPVSMHLLLGDGTERTFRVAEYSRYVRTVKQRFEEFLTARPETYPECCDRCAFCHWRERCEAQWVADGHLNQVAGITSLQIRRLSDAGVRTVTALAALPVTARIEKIHPEVLARLREQAALQHGKQASGEDKVVVLALDPEKRRGFYRLPQPDPGDVFLDLEGDPLEPDGLEYLFGLCCVEDGRAVYRAFWAHTRAEERRAFEDVMDFLAARLDRHPAMHIYHYGHYEPGAFKRLMSLHGTREAEVDQFLREARFVDLLKVVRKAVRTSEPGYSLKNIERFYMGPREGEVKDAAASIVNYEAWRETRNPDLLEAIERYNEFDCLSTLKLREWLIGLRPDGVPWFAPGENESTAPAADAEAEARRREAEERLASYEAALLSSLPADRVGWAGQDRVRELAFQLLDFHRRAAKPVWWAMFDWHEMAEDELIDDPESLGGLRADPRHPPFKDKRSTVYTFRYPAQDSKLKKGDRCRRADTLEPLGSIFDLDEEARIVRLKLGSSRSPLPAAVSIIPEGPLDDRVLRGAVARFADSLVAADGGYPSLRALLGREAPRFAETTPPRFAPGTPPQLRRGKLSVLDEGIDAAARLDASYLFVQGPPGAGKTYTGSRMIVELVRRGFRVGISSNSHKAINNLLQAVDDHAREKRVEFSGVKKSVNGAPDTEYDGLGIENVYANADIFAGEFQLIAGTAWLFACPELDSALDYLFVDEAGQVSLGHLVAMGTSARNIVLLGDQMQLAQPIQGVHPGRSGESVLDYLLDGQATIAGERGIFLPTTYRMHPEVCGFISDAVYDSKLHPEPANARQKLVLAADHHPALRPAGLVFVPAAHTGCSQKSEEEAEIVRAIYASLLEQRYRNKKGKVAAMGVESVLVVSPYNMQVNLLRSMLPEGARVGTVDRFQGQEAEAVIVSMATSSGDDLPRHMEFLYSRNRLNVALSRARSLAILIANPALMAIRCTSPEQMALVNTLCWAREYAGRASSPP